MLHSPPQGKALFTHARRPEGSPVRDYYQRFAHQYRDATFSIDPSPFLEPLIRLMPPPARILDIGCGSGRDMLWLEKRGYRAEGIERSTALARFAREVTGCRVLEADFETFDFSSTHADALLLVGALVHTPRERFAPILTRMLPALPEGGLVYLSLKEGEGVSRRDDGRVFHLWREDDLEKDLHASGLQVLHGSRNVSSLDPKDVWLGRVLRKGGETERS